MKRYLTEALSWLMFLGMIVVTYVTLSPETFWQRLATVLFVVPASFVLTVLILAVICKE